MSHKIVGQVVDKRNNTEVLPIFDNDEISVAIDRDGGCHLIIKDGDLSTFNLKDYMLVLKETYK